MTSADIRFDCRHRGNGGLLVIVPHIDGAPLTELIEGFELAAGMQPAGDAYGGLMPESFRFGPMQDHFLGRSTSTMGPKTPVLGCECGEWGCWPRWTWRVPRRLEIEASERRDPDWPLGWEMMPFPRPASVEVVT
ncbi:hypothetical protein [Streptomyces sp. NPDC013455]|uniref:hypothetical protein n=1 Tax=Streptomyces sp. NPDC013455 TaxID=3155605 RepID=UPI0033C5A8AF